MKAFCDGGDLAEAVGRAIRAISTRSNNPILDNIRIEATEGTMVLTATDNELTVTTGIVADVSDGGVALVPGKLFSDFTRRLTGERIAMETAGSKLVLRYGDSESEFACAEPDDYPELTEVSTSGSISMTKNALRDLINKVAFSVRTDDVRPILKGVLFEIGESTVTAVALDGYRLAKCVKPLISATGEMKAVVPARCVNEIARLLDESDEEVRLYIGKGKVRADIGHTTITSVLYEGEFVAYRNIIRTSFDTQVTVAAQQLYDSLERALLLTRDDRSNPVRFDITERMLRITSASGRGNLDERLPVVTSGPDLTIAFNAKYFTELLRVCGADSVTIKLNSPADPCVVVPCGGEEEFLYLILPVRVA
ncbi:MAG TPA: DNA polymerase III subunit beta [Candidatus Protoclostridium stercorigallinarum]|uniref:Beta sliding clamp n=1 Tax=Candidatus Protoclostridium stercorigallinarum TaxID=2838741 RepID=A0A9D1Q282_9FIRM|nr:DNA polymerase III subunit beta [Candidatus Protoclostridium stercorigallinarum]